MCLIMQSHCKIVILVTSLDYCRSHISIIENFFKKVYVLSGNIICDNVKVVVVYVIINVVSQFD